MTVYMKWDYIPGGYWKYFEIGVCGPRVKTPTPLLRKKCDFHTPLLTNTHDFHTPLLNSFQLLIPYYVLDFVFYTLQLTFYEDSGPVV